MEVESKKKKFKNFMLIILLAIILFVAIMIGGPSLLNSVFDDVCGEMSNDFEEVKYTLIDLEDNIIIVGETTMDWGDDQALYDFPTTLPHIGSVVPGNGFNYDIFASKFSSSGDLLWSVTIGGLEDDSIIDAKIDSNNNIIIFGEIYREQFDGFHVENNEYPAMDTDQQFLIKLNNEGNLIFSQTFGSDIFSYGKGLAIDSNDDIIISGNIEGNFLNFDVTPSKIGPAGSQNVFLIKFSPHGTIEWYTLIGGSASDTNYNMYQKGEILSLLVIVESWDFPLGSSGTAIVNFGINGTHLETIDLESSYIHKIIYRDENNNYLLQFGDRSIMKYHANGSLLQTLELPGDYQLYSNKIIGNYIYLIGSDVDFSRFIENYSNIIIIGTNTTNTRELYEFSYLMKFTLDTFVYVDGIAMDFDYSFRSQSIDIDFYGNIVLGGFSEQKGGTIVNGYQSELHGTVDAYLMKLDPQYNLDWNSYFGKIGGTLKNCF